MMASTQKYANLADDSYKDIDQEKFIKDREIYKIKSEEYKILEQFSNKETDYQGTIYQDVNTGEIFISHRGTASMADGIVDYLMATQNVNLQVPHALTLTQRAINWAKDYAEDNNISPPPN